MKRNQIVIIILVITLGISLTINFIFFNKSRQYYLQFNAALLNPLGLDVYPSHLIPEPADTSRTRVVFFGDSRANRWAPPSDLKKFQFINRSIEAQTSAQVLARFDSHVMPLHPAIIIIQIGVNDLRTIPLFPDQRETIIANCKKNIALIVHKALNQDSRVILTTIFPLGDASFKQKIFLSPDFLYSIHEVNQFIHSLAGERVVILDTDSVLADKNGRIKKEYQYDYLHVNEKSYIALNKKLIPLLEGIQ